MARSIIMLLIVGWFIGSFAHSLGAKNDQTTVRLTDRYPFLRIKCRSRSAFNLPVCHKYWAILPDSTIWPNTTGLLSIMAPVTSPTPTVIVVASNTPCWLTIVLSIFGAGCSLYAAIFSFLRFKLKMSTSSSLRLGLPLHSRRDVLNSEASSVLVRLGDVSQQSANA